MFVDLSPPNWRMDLGTDDGDVWRLLHLSSGITKASRHCPFQMTDLT
jgi:hypothetical protein